MEDHQGIPDYKLEEKVFEKNISEEGKGKLSLIYIVTKKTA